METNPPPKKAKQTPWDPAFKQLMLKTLSTLGLNVTEDISLGDLPLEADLVVITQAHTSDEWREHPVWQHLSDANLIEFKSVADPLKHGDFEVLLAYTLLYRFKYQVEYKTQLSSWLILPAVNKHLKAALKNYQIKLTEILPGLWKGKTIFPLYVVAYNQLPFEMPYQTLKLFIKSGKPVQEVFQAVLESEHRETWIKAVQTAMDLIHPKDFRKVMTEMSLATERRELRETLKELLKDDIKKDIEQAVHEGELTALQTTAKRMLADGMSIKAVSKYTGLSADQIKKLK